MALTKIGTDGVKDDAVTTDKLANAINTERTANTAKVSTTINNNADNRVITGSGTANTLEGEANLTYNGTDLQLTTDANNEGIKINGGTTYPVFEIDANRGVGATLGKVVSKWNGTQIASINFSSGSDGTNKDDGHIAFSTSSAANIAERMRIDKVGNVGIGTTDPAEILHLKEGTNKNLHFTGGIGQIGNVTGFYAVNDANDTIVDIGMTGSTVRFGTIAGERGRFTGDGLTFNGDTAAANALDDYEEGTWSPTITSGVDGGAAYAEQRGWYIKIGHLIQVSFYLQFANSNTGSTGNGNIIAIGGLPVASANTTPNYSSGGVVTFTNANWSNATSQINLYLGDNTSDFYCYRDRGTNAALSGGNPAKAIYGVATYRCHA